MVSAIFLLGGRRRRALPCHASYDSALRILSFLIGLFM
jgi:hypothetical protein